MKTISWNNLKMEIDAIQNIKDSIKLLNDLDNQKANQKEAVASNESN